MNASQGYKAYRLLKDILEERRSIKDQIEELKPLFEFANTPVLTDKKKRNNVVNKIENKHHLNKNADELKRYNVRVLTGIFGEVIKKEAV